jgi:hypothetical protein
MSSALVALINPQQQPLPLILTLPLLLLLLLLQTMDTQNSKR